MLLALLCLLPSADAPLQVVTAVLNAKPLRMYLDRYRNIRGGGVWVEGTFVAWDKPAVEVEAAGRTIALLPIGSKYYVGASRRQSLPARGVFIQKIFINGENAFVVGQVPSEGIFWHCRLRHRDEWNVIHLQLIEHEPVTPDLRRQSPVMGDPKINTP